MARKGKIYVQAYVTETERNRLAHLATRNFRSMAAMIRYLINQAYDKDQAVSETIRGIVNSSHKKEVTP